MAKRFNCMSRVIIKCSKKANNLNQTSPKVFVERYFSSLTVLDLSDFFVNAVLRIAILTACFKDVTNFRCAINSRIEPKKHLLYFSSNTKLFELLHHICSVACNVKIEKYSFKAFFCTKKSYLFQY